LNHLSFSESHHQSTPVDRLSIVCTPISTFVPVAALVSLCSRSAEGVRVDPGVGIRDIPKPLTSPRVLILGSIMIELGDTQHPC
jgi:hypothetical protein